MFKWLQNRVRDAFLAGVQEGIDALSTPSTNGLVLPEPRLLRLPAPEPEDATDTDGKQDATSTRRRKGS